MRPSPLVLLAAAAAALQLACTEANPLYCTSNTQCQERDTSRPFCDVTGSFAGTGNRCIALPGDAGDMCSGHAECTTAEEPICDPQFELCRPCGGTGGDAECAERDQDKGVCASDGRCVQCVDSVDCPATGTPICDSEMCGACTDDEAGDTACAEREDGLDYCSGGSCVACREDSHCPAETPVCDDTSHTCRTCADHDECGSEVCHPDNGQCAPPGDVLYVATNGVDGVSCGSQGSPCKTVSGTSGALPKLGAKTYIKIRAGSYTEAVQIVGGETVTLVGASPTPPSFEPPSGSPGIRVDNAANVTLIDLAFVNGRPDSSGDGVRCQGGSTVRLLRVSAERCSGNGLDADACAQVRIERSTFDANDLGGIRLSETAFVVTNNYITNNGNAGSSSFGGVNIQNPTGISPQTLEFNTIARNQAQDGAPTGALCLNSSITGRYNILWGGIGSNTTVSGNCSWQDNDIEGGFSGGNLDLDPKFVSPTVRNFHLMDDSPLEGEASGGSIAVDFDGDTRPQGTGRDIGADEITP